MRDAAAAPAWMRWLLLASLALNLLVAGLVVGDALVDGPRGPRPTDLALGAVAEALEPSDRRAILHALRGRHDLRPFGREEPGAALAALAGAARADPFDRAAAEAALEAQGARVERAEAAVRAALLDHLAAMAPAERAAFADRLMAGARGAGRG